MERQDPLRELRSEARNIANAYDQLGGSLAITVVGALHEGNPGADILDQVFNADTTTLELPSISVNAYQQGHLSLLQYDL
jgi:hypothetical protein